MLPDCHSLLRGSKMDRNEIALRARQIETKEQLLDLLNMIKRDETTSVFYPFTIKHLNYYCNPNNVFHRYKKFSIKKKSGGKRLITAPRNQSFMLILRYVNEILKAVYTPSDYAMGFVEGRSVVTNADIHKGQNYVFNIDIKDFFPSIVQSRVWKRLQLQPICLKKSVASILAGLCSMKFVAEDGSVHYVLPQGSPTSPILTNMICDKLDRRLAGLAKRFRLKYSRYADDITFSSQENVYQLDGDFRKELKRIIEEQGFKMNEAKTRLQKRGSRQEVTGIIVNEKLNVTQKYVRDIRNILYIWSRYGYDTAYNKFLPKYKSEKTYQRKGNPDMVNVIAGKLLYLKMVKGEEDSVYVRLKDKFDLLTNDIKDINKTTAQGVTYFETTPLLTFEKKNKTTINILWSKPNAINADAEFDASNSNKSHRYAQFILGGKKQNASVHKSVKKEEEKQKDILSISHCRDAKGKLFWLVHRSDRVNVRQEPVDIDELNRELDYFLI